MILYTCTSCDELYSFDETRLVNDHIICDECYSNELWKNRKDPRQAVLDLIDSLQNEVRRAAGRNFYDNIYCAMEVRDILTEIQQAIYDMEV